MEVICSSLPFFSMRKLPSSLSIMSARVATVPSPPVSVSYTHLGDGYVIAGNILTGEDVLTEMEKAFLRTEGPLADRLMQALLAADSCGGDRRGKMAAVIRVDKVQGFPYIDFRVDDHPDAVVELNKIYQKNKAHIFETYDNWVENVKQGVKG